MKTAESLIKKQAGKAIVDLMLVKLDQWAKHEFNYVRHALDIPVLLPLNDKTWVLGNFYIKHLAQHKFQVTQDRKLVHTFYSKQAAVFYTVLTKLHKYKTADDILDKDRCVAKYNDELEFYSKKLLQKKKIDPFKLQLWQTRYFEAKAQYAAAKEQLEKKLLNVKYMKVWSQILGDQTSPRNG